MLLEAVREGLRLLTWSQDSFAYADSFDDDAGRYRGLCCGQMVNVSEDNLSGLLVRPEVALKQHQAETAPAPSGFGESLAVVSWRDRPYLLRREVKAEPRARTGRAGPNGSTAA